ncbi:hypothetical protein EDC04DRAFT_2214485 [Pisolithus marmoratus]|nr:hypothetical protein EDC04DRAFT_2214485 [Pisolithus marmoratus]
MESSVHEGLDSPTTMSLSSVPNTLDDATHEVLDKQVHERVSLFISGKPGLSDCMFLLQTIVRLSNGTLDPKYYDSFNATDLIMSQPGLTTMLHAAWSSGSYRDIRNLEILQVPRPLTTKARLPAEVENKLHRAFIAPYHGKAVDAFYEYLEHNNTKFARGSGGGPPKYYGKFCSIVQSSGTGKSRLLFEGVLVLYMNLRPSDDKTGFPARDDVPAEILTPHPGIDAVDYSARCCAFFAAVFTTVREYLLVSRGLEDALKQWNDSMCNLRSEDRKQFFMTLKAKYTTYYKKIKGNAPDDTVAEAARKLSDLSLSAERVEQQMEQDNQSMKHDERATEQAEQTTERAEQAPSSMPGQEIMISAYREMVNVLDELFRSGECHKPKVVLALDEAHPLSGMKKSEGYRPSTILCRAISLYSGADRTANHAVWVVFASTTSKVADFAAPQAFHDSARVFAAGQLVYPPYCQLGWDQRADPLKAIAAVDVAQAGHIIGFGRVLWKSIQELYDVEGMMEVAMSKLSGSSANENLPLVTLSQRICLNLTLGHREAVKFSTSAVASHLRVCISITEDRNWSFTTYPSEPFLSCAAAALLHEGCNLDTFLKALEEKILSGMVDVGQSGELASRLLWLLAKDLYVRRTPLHGLVIPAGDGQKWNSQLVDCQMISVIEYFHFVFGDNFWDLAGEEAKGAFKDAYVNFSHWVSMDENISVPKDGDDQLDTKEWTLRHWHRTSAVQCCHYQPLVDKMIPIYFKENKPPRKGLSHADDLSRVSQIFISDKAGRSSNQSALHKITRSHESINCSSSLPWVAILVDFGVKTPTVQPTFPARQSERLKTQDVGQCLRIHATAISVDTFPFLSRNEQLRSTLQNIIVYEEFPPNGGKRAQHLEERVRYGSTCKKGHMRWEGEASETGDQGGDQESD